MSFIEQYLESTKVGFAACQIATMLVLYAVGFLTVYSLVAGGKKPSDVKTTRVIKRIIPVISFPVGLSLYIAVGYFLLVAGLFYNAGTVIAAMTLCVIACVANIIVKNKKTSDLCALYNIKEILIIAAVVLGVSLFAVSGLSKISLSNDSLYYFWQYPRAIVDYGGLRDQFDNFLTDTGLGAAVIGTLPFLFGFGETFGIQMFFHISFLAVVFIGMYDSLKCDYEGMDDRKAGCIAGLTMLVVASATPVSILANWAMANMYFMELFLMAVIIAGYIERNGGLYIIFGIIVFACAQIRMEGGIFILFLVMMISLIVEDKRKLAATIIPIVVMQSLYEYRLFFVYTIDNPFTFMTLQKAMMQFAAYVAVFIYLVFAEKIISKYIGKYIGICILGLLAIVNLALCVYDLGHYVANLKAFAGNMLGQSGWGILPYVVIGAIAVLIIWTITDAKQSPQAIEAEEAARDRRFWICMTIGFMMVVVAVSFARGDDLNINTGDSGNRVMLQAAPLIIISLVKCFVDKLEKNK